MHRLTLSKTESRKREMKEKWKEGSFQGRESIRLCVRFTFHVSGVGEAGLEGAASVPVPEFPAYLTLSNCSTSHNIDFSHILGTDDTFESDRSDPWVSSSTDALLSRKLFPLPPGRPHSGFSSLLPQLKGSGYPCNSPRSLTIYYYSIEYNTKL
jgi:hypothetical protein